MSHFRLHSKTKGKDRLGYLMIGIVCVLAVGGIGYAAHSIGTASAKSREKILIYTEEELEQYLLDEESEEYNLNGRYQLEEDLELGWLWKSIGTNVEPFTGSFDGNGHVISGLTRPLFGVMKKASVENLFLSETMITNPCTYYDGEHYVDGYGALAAYVIDSEIANCGMGGEIQASNPVETWYQIEKASPAEALERKELETTEEVTEEVIGPAGDETPEGTETEVRGPGVGGGAENGGAEGSQPESSVEESSQVESGQFESSFSGSGQLESSSSESSQPGGSPSESSQSGSNPSESGQSGSNPSESDQSGSSPSESGQSGSSPSESGQSGNRPSENSQPGGSPSENSQSGNRPSENSQPESSSLENSRPESNPSENVQSGKHQEESVQTDKTQADNSIDEPDEEPETVALQKIDRQYRMMKLSEVIGPDMEADLAEATPSDAQEVHEPNTATPSEAEEEQENSYMGGDGEALYLAVTADRIAAGGLIAQMEGTTTVTDCFTCATIITQIDADTWTGGFAGRLGEAVHLENSYSSGVLDGCDRVGGFVADNQGRIENSYSSTALTMSGRIRGGFTAEGGGQLTDCVYDCQMASVDDENGQETETIGVEPLTASPTDSATISLEARNTIQMSGIEEYIPGTWYQTDNAYPQIEYFALHENQTIADYSRVSAVTLILPESMTLRNITLEEGQIILPEEMDGQSIMWSAEGDIHIDDHYQIQMGSRADDAPEAAEPSETKMPRGPGVEVSEETKVSNDWGWENSAALSMKERLLKTSSYESQEIKESEPELEPDSTTPKKAQIKAVSGVAAKIYPLDINPLADEEIGVIYENWNAVGEAVYNDTNGMGIYKPTKGDGSTNDPFEIGTPEALAWFRYAVYAETRTYWCIVLTADLDMNGEKYNDGAGKLQWMGIETSHTVKQRGYAGTVDGGGHALSNFYSSDGFIGGAFDGTVRDFGIESGEVSGGSAGGIARETVYVEFTGFRTRAVFERCYNKANITATGAGYPYAAGIVAIAREGTRIIDCYNTGTITAVYKGECRAGGIAAYAPTIVNCYNTGQVTMDGSPNSTLADGVSPGGSLTNCYSLEGMAAGKRGIIRTETQMKSWAFAYKLNGEKMDGAWKYTEGKTPGFGTLDAASSWSAVTQGVTDGFITAIAASDDGTGFYAIDTADKLALFARDVNAGTKSTANAKLTANIDLTGTKYGGISDAPVPWTPIGTLDNIYQGNFNGNGKVIANMKVEQAGVGGLFGYAGGGASIEKLGLDTTCLVTTTAPAADADSGTAALVGVVKNTGSSSMQISITSCYNRASVSGHSSYTGAFVGHTMNVNASGTHIISNSFTTGPLKTSSGTIGAIAGNFPSTASAAGIQYCYWDKETSSDTTLNAVGLESTAQTSVSGKTTGEMKADAILSLLNTGLSPAVWVRSDDINNGYPSFHTALAEYTDWAAVGAAAPEPTYRYASGTITPGTVGNPYLIKSPEDLAWFAYQVNQVNGRNNLCGKLMSNINLYGSFYNGENSYDPSDSSATLDKALKWVPIGSVNTTGKTYTGTFDGNGYTVSVISIEVATDGTAGVFGILGNNARITNLGIGKGPVQLTGSYAGGIVGYIEGQDVAVTGCWNEGTLMGSGVTAIGGIIGSTGNTSDKVVVNGCYHAGTVTSPDSGAYIGGIVGELQAKSGGTASVQNSYNRGIIGGNEAAGWGGGIVGLLTTNGIVKQCYNAGNVKAAKGANAIVGNGNTAAVSYCFYDKNYTVDNGTTGITGVVHKEFAAWGAAYGLNGERLIQEDSEISWTYVAGNEYPTYGILPGTENWQDVGQAAAAGFIAITEPAGSADTSMKIETAEQLAWFAWKVNTGAALATQNIELTKDINLFGEKYSGYTGEKDLTNIEKAVNWSPIGSEAYPYKGTFHGGKCEIDGMYINGDNYLGLIGAAMYPAKVKEVGIGANSKVICHNNFGGLLIGAIMVTNNPVEITSCYNLGTIVGMGGTYIAAFVGDDNGNSTPNSAILSNCYNAGDTTGFARLSVGTINNCYTDISVNSKNITCENKYGSGLKGMTTDEMKTSEMAASLNTFSGTLKTGTDRVWYTSLDTEKTKGYPTFQAPTTVQVTFTPDTMGENGTAETLPESLSIPDMKLRAIGLTDENFTPGRVPASDKDYQLVTESSIKGTDSGYGSYGYTNANKNVAVKAGTVDLQPVEASASLHNPVTEMGTVDKVSLNIAAAYNRSAQRNLLLEGASGNERYEICIAIAGVTNKTLSVTVPVKVPIELSPDGTKKTSHSADLTLTNNNVYPIAGRILSLTPIEQDGYVPLKPVAKNDNYGSTKQISDLNGGVKLGIEDTKTPSGIIPSDGYYYTPAKTGTAENWMSYRIKGKGSLPYRYFIEYEANPYYRDTNTYGFTVNYQFGISEQDAPAVAAVVGDGVSS